MNHGNPYQKPRFPRMARQHLASLARSCYSNRHMSSLVCKMTKPKSSKLPEQRVSEMKLGVAVACCIRLIFPEKIGCFMQFGLRPQAPQSPNASQCDHATFAHPTSKTCKAATSNEARDLRWHSRYLPLAVAGPTSSNM